SLKKYGHYIQSLDIDLYGDDINRLMAAAPEKVFSSAWWRGIEQVVFEYNGDFYEECEPVTFGKKSVEALKEHYSTLEVFRAKVAAFSSKDIQELLCSAPRLLEFNILPKDRLLSIHKFMPSLN
ncbi:hypothetical protein BGW41_005847, partial [Actinomortierella wolfii]